ncbi:MAG: AMP-binding protein [Pseudomonadota bacterium]
MPLEGPPLTENIDLNRLLARGLSARPDDCALASADTRMSWRQLDAASDHLARGYLGLGLKAGDRVASLMPNRAALIVHYLACIKAGLVATPLNYRYQPPEIDHALRVSGASLILAHCERAEDLAVSQLAGELPLGWVAYGGDMTDGAGKNWPRCEDLITTCDTDTPLIEPDSDAPAFIFFTSGSTGHPKGVTHSLKTMGNIVACGIQMLEMTDQDTLLPGSSCSHIGSFMTSLMGLAAGARVDVARTFDGDELLPLLRDTRPTILLMLPAALIALMHDHNARPEDFSSLRLCISGGDKVPAELEKEFTDMVGFPIDELYGMTEIGLASGNPPSGINKIGSIGLAAPGFSLSIRDENGAEVPTGQEGRLWVKGPCNLTAYWENPEATAETIVDGWVDTGDIMKADEDGYIWFCGRKKQIIVHDGSNICPQEVEEALVAHPAIDNAGVVGVHDLVHGENVCAYVTLTPGTARPSRQDLIQFARTRVGYKAPEVIIFLEEMPLNATGKVDRVTLKNWARERH